MNENAMVAMIGARVRESIVLRRVAAKYETIALRDHVSPTKPVGDG